MANPEVTIPERLLALLEEQKMTLRRSDLSRYEAGSQEVDALIEAWSNRQGTEPIAPNQREAVMASLEQLTLIVAASQQALSDKVRHIRRHRRTVSVYQEGT